MSPVIIVSLFSFCTVSSLLDSVYTKFLHWCFDELGGRYNAAIKNWLAFLKEISSHIISRLSHSKSFLLVYRIPSLIYAPTPPSICLQFLYSKLQPPISTSVKFLWDKNVSLSEKMLTLLLNKKSATKSFFPSIRLMFLWKTEKPCLVSKSCRLVCVCTDPGHVSISPHNKSNKYMTLLADKRFNVV